MELAPNDGHDLGESDLEDSLKTLRKQFGGRTPKKVLDLGCGNGRFAEAFLNAFPNTKMDVLDKNVHYVDHVRSKPELGGKIRNYFTISALLVHTITKEKYDLIFVQGVAQYLTDKKFSTLLTSVRKVLKPDGLLVFKELYNDHFTEYLAKEKNWVRSYGCFVDLFKQSKYDSDMVSEFCYKIDYYTYMTFTLKKSDAPMDSNSLQKELHNEDRTHNEQCFGQIKG